ncbi:MAG: hypothetical protein ABIK18_01895, partial [candidate division WOR-3 bacterium]
QYDFTRLSRKERGDIEIEFLKCGNTPARYRIDETDMELFLPQPLSPGDSVVIELSFTTKLPALIQNLGRKGSVFILTHWHPQVKSDTGGVVFADYLISLVVPPGYKVAGSGEPLSSGSQAGYRFRANNVSDFGLVVGQRFVIFTDSSTTPRVNLFLSQHLAKQASAIISYARLSLGLFSRWFGNYPFPQLTIVDGTGIAPGEISAPGIVIFNQKPVPGTRLLERQIVTEIARQWFGQIVNPESEKNPALTDGLAAYAAMRYLKTLYGADNLLDLPINIPFLKGISDEYLHRIYYYIAATNHLSRPIITPFEKTPDRFTREAVGKSQAVLVFSKIEEELGTMVFDSCLRHYLFSQRGTSPTVEALINSITDIAGDEAKVKAVEQGFNLAFPITVKESKSGGSHTSTCQNRVPYTQPEPRPKPKLFNPIFAIPDFETYQIFYGPWFWYDNYRGFQPGVWLQGRRFIDAGPLRGEHQWTILENYNSNKSDWHTGISYQTPLLFSPCRLRLCLTGDNSFRDRGVRVYLNGEIGPPFRLPRSEFNIGYRLYELLDTTGRDARAWEKGRTGEIKTTLGSWSETPFFQFKHRLTFSRALKPVLSQFQYTKISLEEKSTTFLPGITPFTIRLFAGLISGSAPAQEEFYLSGGLSYTPAEPLSWGYKGSFSGQERWHYDGDVNCRGYYGVYHHGRYAYGININLHLPFLGLQPFLDIGNVADSLNQPDFFKPLFDAGIRLKLGMFYADFPIWKSHPEEGERPFALRWTLGFKLYEPLGNF